jgi:hypothetical protein
VATAEMTTPATKPVRITVTATRIVSNSDSNSDNKVTTALPKAPTRLKLPTTTVATEIIQAL